MPVATVIFTLILGLGLSANAQKVIKDPAEYNAYISAINESTPAKKAAAMEAFISAYPASVVKEDALEQAMSAYQEAGDQAKVLSTAQRLLDLYPNHVRALAIIVFIKRNAATQDTKSIAEIALLAERGLMSLASWQKPADMPDADFAKIRLQVTSIFNGSAGFAALQTKDYTKARGYYAAAVQADPTSLQDDYQFAIAELAGTPVEPAGFWYAAKAASLAKAQNNDAGFKSIDSYGRAMYKNYHGGEDGWDALIAASVSQSAPPNGFSVKPKMSAAELAVEAAAQYDPKDLSFSDKEFILSYRDASPANRLAAEKVWKSLRDLQKNGTAALQIPVKVISATGTSMTAAIDPDNQAANKADVEITFSMPLLHPPAAGSEVKVIGFLTDYRAAPFMFVMTKARIAP